jgi:NDP-sugar pyrophosphorylase family protein
MFSVAILCGGLATRLRPITESIPKALLNVANKPFIEWQLEYLQGQGVTRVVICIGYLGELIKKNIGTGEQFGLQVYYSNDGPNLLGTGGALKQALPKLGDNFFVLYGDSFLPLDFVNVQKAYINSGKKALMTIFQNHDLWDKSNVIFKEGRILEYDKYNPKPEMTYIDYGLGVLSSELFIQYPKFAPFDLADIYKNLSLQEQLAGLEVNERFYEIGSKSGLKAAEEFFLNKRKSI